MTSKQLTLLRHAKSDWSSGAANDFGRPLSARGRRDAPQIGRWLAENGYVPQRIVGSPAARTTETIELVCAALDLNSEDDDLVIYDGDLYHATPARIQEIVAWHLRQVDRVLVVAHNPGMELALLEYCPAAEPFADGKIMPTCAAAVIEFDGGESADARLRALMRPSLL